MEAAVPFLISLVLRTLEAKLQISRTALGQSWSFHINEVPGLEQILTSAHFTYKLLLILIHRKCTMSQYVPITFFFMWSFPCLPPLSDHSVSLHTTTPECSLKSLIYRQIQGDKEAVVQSVQS